MLYKNLGRVSAHGAVVYLIGIFLIINPQRAIGPFANTAYGYTEIIPWNIIGKLAGVKILTSVV